MEENNKEKNMSDYYKYQWDYKKKNYYTITLPLRYNEEADLIESLKNFAGNRTEWIKKVIRNSLVSEGRYKSSRE